MLPSLLPLLQVHLSGHITRDIRFPDAAAFRWRGELGRALKTAVCINPQTACKDCFLRHHCTYSLVFETPMPPQTTVLKKYPTAPHPFTLVVSPGWGREQRCGEPFTLELTLFGHGRKYRDLLLQNLQTLAENSAPRLPGWAKFTEIQDLTIDPVLPPVPDKARIKLTSPLRLREKNRELKLEHFTFRHFAMALLRRLSLLCHCHGALEIDFKGLRDEAITVLIDPSALSWHPLWRHSARQGQRLPMGGIEGEFLLTGEALARWWPYLWFGQWTGIGRGASMGLGQYRLTELS